MKIKIRGVRFNNMTGEPKVVECSIELRHHDSLGNILEMSDGVTGYESICLEGACGVHWENLVLRGWWACLGAAGRWDALYFHGQQMKLVRDAVRKELDA